MKGLITGIACFIFLGSTASAQSIYSAQGLGSLNSQGNPNNFSMGGLGIGTPTQWNINTKNPAYLPLNPFSTFEVGLTFNKRNFSGNGVSGSDAGGGLNFLAYSFPIKPGVWSSSFGILPYSTVNYDIFSEGPIDGAPNNATFLLDQKGEGGLTNLFWSNGVAINKNFFVGVKSNFTFGSIVRSSKVAIFEEKTFSSFKEDDDGELVEVIDTLLVSFSSDVEVTNTESYKDFNFQFGFAYKFFLTESKFLNLGLTYAPESTLNGKIERQDSVTTSFDQHSILPKSLGFGVSYQKLNAFLIGLDVEAQSWKEAYFNSNSYKNSLKIVLGGNWTPDYDNVNSVFRRSTYSIGFNYQELPYIVNNQGLTEFGINFGASLPVNGYSSFDMAFKVGQLGETNNGLIKETFFKVVIGATINDRWFIKRKYD